jgi:hypothetical protein
VPETLVDTAMALETPERSDKAPKHPEGRPEASHLRHSAYGTPYVNELLANRARAYEAPHRDGGRDLTHLVIPPIYTSEATSTKETARADRGASERAVISPGPEKLTSGSKPSVEIQYASEKQAAGEQPEKPYTFKLDEHGQVVDSNGQKVTKNISFENGVPKKIVISVDKPENFAKMTQTEQAEAMAQQQTRLDDFVRNTLTPALRAASPEAASQGINLDDATHGLPKDTVQAVNQAEGVLRPAVELPTAQAEKASAASPAGYSGPATEAYRGVPGRHGERSGYRSGSMPGGEANAGDLFPHGAQRTPVENAAYQETLAASFGPDEREPYGTIRQGTDHSYAVGRYGYSYHHFTNLMHRALDGAMQKWPSSILDQLKDANGDIDWSKLAEVLKEHPDLMQDVQASVNAAGLPDALASKFADADKLGQFGSFVQKMRGAGSITPEDLATNFGKDEQDAMAQETVNRAIGAGKTAAQAALAQHLGIEPDQLTEAQLNDPANRQFLDDANNLAQQALAKADLDPQIAHQMAEWAVDWARTNQTFDPATGCGNCTRLWRRAIEGITGQDIGSMSGVQQTYLIADLARQGYFRQVSESEAQEGDFGGRGWSPRVAAAYGHNLGDSFMVVGRDGDAVYGANGASHVPFIANGNNPRYTNNVYFRATKKLEELFQNGDSNS